MMGTNTKISWADHTASPWYGCSEVHAGCDNCFARELSKRNPETLGVWGDAGTRVKSKSFIRNLRAWNKKAEQEGKVASVFPSLCDPFEDRPELVEWREEMFSVIDELPWIRLLLLTKRPKNIRGMWPENRNTITARDSQRYTYRHNVWLLASVSDQATADAMIPHLLKCWDLSPVLGVSAEPLLGPIDFTQIKAAKDMDCDSLRGEYRQWCDEGIDHPGAEQFFPDGPKLDWIITGGESGPHARPHNVQWSRDIGQQCQAAGVAWWHKQHGSRPIQGGDFQAKTGPMEAIVLKDRSGSDPTEWGPGWLQQMPTNERIHNANNLEARP
jgi:protein gp37